MSNANFRDIVFVLLEIFKNAQALNKKSFCLVYFQMLFCYFKAQNLNVERNTYFEQNSLFLLVVFYL